MKCKKILALIVCMAMLWSLAACGGKATSSVEGSAPETTSAEVQPQQTPEVVEKSTEEPASVVPAEPERAVIEYPLTEDDLTISMSFDMPGGVGTRFTDFNEHTVFQEVEKRTGVHVEFISAGGMGDAEALTLWAAAGTLPDLIPNAAANYPGGGEVAVADDILLDVFP